MLTLMVLGQMQPHADAHQYAGCKQLNGHWLSQEDHGRKMCLETGLSTQPGTHRVKSGY